MINVITWNVNSINVRKEQLLSLLSNHKPDVVLLQETKCEDHKFPHEEIEDLGYNIKTHGQKTFNGVAILSLFPIDESTTHLENNPLPEHARYIEAVLSLPNSAIRVASVYVPNGEDMDSLKLQQKFDFYDALYKHAQNLLKFEEKLFIGGDFNVAPEEIDSYNPVATENSILFHISVRKKFRELLNLGLKSAYRTLYPNESQFTWWDYRQGSWQRNKGMMIDHILLSPEALDCLAESEVLDSFRANTKPSDHAPVSCSIKHE